MSQPFDRPLDLAFGKEMSARFHSDYLRFSGYNRMTDGSISQMEGALKQAYCGTDCLCAISIDWDAIAGNCVRRTRTASVFLSTRRETRRSQRYWISMSAAAATKMGG